jgi:hypothetical protein
MSCTGWMAWIHKLFDTSERKVETLFAARDCGEFFNAGLLLAHDLFKVFDCSSEAFPKRNLRFPAEGFLRKPDVGAALGRVVAGKRFIDELRF